MDEFLFGFAEHKLDSHFNMHLIHHLVIVTWIGKPAVNDKEFECLYTVKKDWKGEKSHPTHTVILQKKALLLVDQTQTDILWKDEGRNMEKVILRNTSKLFERVCNSSKYINMVKLLRPHTVKKMGGK